MYKIDWHIVFNGEKIWKLSFLESVEIHESVDSLADTAMIRLPGTMLNKQLEVESKIKVGDQVTIQLGYDGNLKTEFQGYLQSIATDDRSIILTCEDGIYLTRLAVKEKEFKSSSNKDIAQYVVDQVNLLLSEDRKITLVCDQTDKTFDKFTIPTNCNGYDVLKKLQDETKSNIYMKGSELHIHYAYIEKFGEAIYDFARNIEKSELKYRRADERNIEVYVEGIDKDGKKKIVKVGKPGGEKRTVICGSTDESIMEKRGQEELKYLVFDGYEGSLTGWLIPECHPGYSAEIIDKDYEYKTGTYYVVTVTTTASEAGISRKVELGRKLS